MLSYRIHINAKIIALVLFFIVFLSSCDMLQDTDVKKVLNVEIISPKEGSYFKSSEEIEFRGWAIDHEDKGVLDQNLHWSSSIDGLLGSGKQIDKKLSPGVHEITLTAEEGGITGSKKVSGVTVHGELELRIISPESGALYFVGDVIPCKAEVEPSEYADSVIWKLNGNPVDCNGEIQIDKRGKYTLSAEVEKEGGFTWRDSVSVEIIPVIIGRIYPLTSYGVRPADAEGLKITFRAGDKEEVTEADIYGIFEIKTKLVAEDEVKVSLEGSDKYYSAFVDSLTVPIPNTTGYYKKKPLSGQDVIEMSEDGKLGFVLAPNVWEIRTGYHSGVSEEIMLKEAFDDTGSEWAYDAFYWINRKSITSILQKDMQLGIYLSRDRSDQEITPSDSIAFWETMDSLHIYLGLGEIFRPATKDDGTVVFYIDSKVGPAGLPRLDNDGNIVGGVFRTTYVRWIWENRANIYHEAMHVMGIGHTCFWVTMMHRVGCPIGTIGHGDSGISSYSPIPTSIDVAHIQLLYAVRQLQYDEGVAFGLIENWRAVR